jgi:hypothetical protein
LLDFAKAPIDARLYLRPAPKHVHVLLDFRDHIVAGVACDGALVDPLDHLLRSQRDEHADDNNPDFAGELAPAVQRLWQMHVHKDAPPDLEAIRSKAGV